MYNVNVYKSNEGTLSVCFQNIYNIKDVKQILVGHQSLSPLAFMYSVFVGEIWLIQCLLAYYDYNGVILIVLASNKLFRPSR